MTEDGTYGLTPEVGDRYYRPPEFFEPEERDDPLDDGDYAYDRWRDEQMEEGDDDDEGFDPALDY